MRLVSLGSLPGAVHPADRAFPRPCEHDSEALRIRRFRTGLGDNNNVEAGQAFSIVTETFPDLTLQAVTCHGATGNTTGDSKPKPGLVGAVGTHDDCHDLRVQTDTAGKDLCEVFPTMQPLLRPETPIGGLVLRQ